LRGKQKQREKREYKQNERGRLAVYHAPHDGHRYVYEKQERCALLDDVRRAVLEVEVVQHREPEEKAAQPAAEMRRERDMLDR